MELDDRRSVRSMAASRRPTGAVVFAATLTCFVALASTAGAQNESPESNEPRQNKEKEPLLSTRTVVTKRTGFELALRSGGELPMGEAAKKGTLSDLVAWQIPIELDLGYRESEGVTYGLYFGYNFGSIGSVIADQCTMGDIKCPVRSLRGGVQVLYHLAPRSQIGGWVSVGMGAESLKAGIESEQASTEAAIKYLGIEFPFQAGLDIRASNGMSFGPYLGFLLGRYLDRTNECSGPVCSMVSGASGGSLGEQSIHMWVLLGFRGAVLL
jgi:hypothetical protein